MPAAWLFMNCPSCDSPMTENVLDGALDRSVAVNLCGRCQAFWFDTYESLQLTPGATLELFRTIGDLAAGGRSGIQLGSRCPRCRSLLLLTHDLQRNTPFTYWRCDQGHGRLITFLEFLREKNFIRPLSASQLAELRRNLQSVQCSSCGAPVDLAKATTCAHCGTPLSVLDLNQAERVIAALRQADRVDHRGEGTSPGSPVMPDAAAQEPPVGKAGGSAGQPADLVRASLTDLMHRLLQ